MINDNYIEVNKNNVKKFLETYCIEDLEVETQNGWVNVECIGKTIPYKKYTITTMDNQLSCADNHVLYKCDDMDFFLKKCNLTEIFTKNLNIGDFIMTKNGPD
jgi:hypothetical protein